MRENKVDAGKRHNPVRVWIGGHRFPNSVGERERSSTNRFHVDGGPTRTSPDVSRDAWFSYRITVIFLSLSGVFYGTWELMHR